MPSPPSSFPPRWRLVLQLGSGQTLAYASTYYLPALLAAPLAADLGLDLATVFAAFSLALAVSALAGPAAGRCLDRRGGRTVLVATNLLFASGLLALAAVQGPWGLLLAWAWLGVGMGSGLYEAAFATAVGWYGREAGRAITGITLVAGFASTVGWPLTAVLIETFGWRGACIGWALLHLLLGLPVHLLLPGSQRSGPAAQPVELRAGAQAPQPPGVTGPPRRVAVLLATVFAAAWFCSTAMAAHLPALLQAMGVSLAAAVAAGALVGPAQVAGRLLEFTWLRRLDPLLSARLASLGHPLGAAALLLAGSALAAPFALLHGLGIGILTIAKGTLPLLYYGPLGYGQRQGWLMMPARLAQAVAPWVFGLGLQAWGRQALLITAAAGLAGLVALLLLPRPPDRLEQWGP